MKVLTANDLLSGETVYRTSADEWSPRLEAAQLYEGEDGAKALAAAESEETQVVGPYLMDASEAREPAGRARLREAIRSIGPTIHPHYAKAERGVL